MTSSKNNDPSINEEMRNVCRDVVSDPVWRHLLDETASILEAFDSGISQEVDFVQSDSKTLHRMVRYCLPVQELHQALDGVSLDPQSLASLFLWQEAWRPLDNLLDSDGKITTNLREYNYSLLRAWSFHQKAYPKSSLMERFLTCLNTTLQIEDDVEARIDPAR